MALCGRVGGMRETGRTHLQQWQHKKLSELKSDNGKQIFKRCTKMARNGKKLLQLMLLSCLILLSGCAAKSNPCPQVSKAAIPPLPTSAEAPPPIKLCLVSCSNGVSEQMKLWLDTPTKTEKPP